MRKGIALILVLAICVVAVCACNDSGEDTAVYVDYSAVNDYEIEKVEEDDYVTYAPMGVEATCGVLFYLGTAIAPAYYEYLTTALAKQGYLVVVSTNLFAYIQYAEEEPTFENYPNVKFFIGGHSQGGGAGVRRAVENADKVAGLFLLAPLTFDGYSLAETDMPVLLLNAENDGVLSSTMKSEAKSRLPESRTEYLIDGCHMSFSTNDDDAILKLFSDGPASAEVKTKQRELTEDYVLDFLKSVASTL